MTSHPYPHKIRQACDNCGTVRRLKVFARTTWEYLGLCAICKMSAENQPA